MGVGQQGGTTSSLMMLQPGYSNLDQKEQDLCNENKIPPEEYLALKKAIAIEASKNKAITEALIKEKGNQYKQLREKVPLVYEFWAKCNTFAK